MKRLIFLLLTIVFASYAATGQNSGSSAMIYPIGDSKTSDYGTATLVGNAVATAMFKEYPCIDAMTTDELQALVGLERWKQLLGEKADEQFLQNLAGAVGANYIITVRVTTLPNGQTVANVVVTDAATGRMLANEMSTDINPQGALETLLKKLMLSLAGVFKRQCEAHWVGTINYTFRIESSKTESWTGFSSGQGIADTKITDTKTENLSETADIVLKAITLGSSGDNTQARATQHFFRLWEHDRTEEGVTACREPGRNTFRKSVSGDEKETRTETGEAAENVSVQITVLNNGKYRIRVYALKQIKTTGRFERSGNIMACKPIPFSSVAEINGLRGVGYIDLEGEIDPKNPLTIIGKKTEGDVTTGKKTWEWKLRRVIPKGKK